MLLQHFGNKKNVYDRLQNIIIVQLHTTCFLGQLKKTSRNTKSLNPLGWVKFRNFSNINCPLTDTTNPYPSASLEVSKNWRLEARMIYSKAIPKYKLWRNSYSNVELIDQCFKKSYLQGGCIVTYLFASPIHQPTKPTHRRSNEDPNPLHCTRCWCSCSIRARTTSMGWRCPSWGLHEAYGRYHWWIFTLVMSACMTM